jgi:hypothetical protein
MTGMGDWNMRCSEERMARRVVVGSKKRVMERGILLTSFSGLAYSCIALSFEDWSLEFATAF